MKPCCNCKYFRKRPKPEDRLLASWIEGFHKGYCKRHIMALPDIQKINCDTWESLPKAILDFERKLDDKKL